MRTIWLLSLLLATGASAAWSITTVDSTGDVGGHCSLALDSSGFPHIAYNDSTNGTVKYAYQDATGWHIETAVTFGSAGLELALVLDPTDRAHLTYFYGAGSTFGMEYAVRQPGGWAHEWVDGNGWLSTSLALDSAGEPLVAYFDNGNTNLLYGWKSGGNWQSAIIDTGPGDYGRDAELALSPYDAPYILYKDITVGMFNLKYWNGTSWQYELVDLGAAQGGGLDLALDPFGLAVAVYHDHTFQSLKLAQRWATGWNVVTVDSAGSTGWNPALSLHVFGFPPEFYPHVSYYDVTNKDLKYFYEDDLDWYVSTVDSAGDVGWYSSIATSPSDYPPVGHAHIAYSDETNGDLKYATDKPGTNVLDVTIRTNQAYYKTGDPFRLDMDLLNSGPPISQDIYVMLDVQGQYWFWPSWVQYPPGVDLQNRSLGSGSTSEMLLQFTWPAASPGMTGLRFYAALLDPGSSNVRDLDYCEWGFGT